MEQLHLDKSINFVATARSVHGQSFPSKWTLYQLQLLLLLWIQCHIMIVNTFDCFSDQMRANSDTKL